jgi:hypothetical protein
MGDDLDPAPPLPSARGNSREYLFQRLQRDGFVELIKAIESGALSVYAAACEAGYRTRPEPTGRGSENARKRRNWAILKAYRESERSEATPEPVQEAPRNGHSIPATPPDLAAALAKWEAAQRPPQRARDNLGTIVPRYEPEPVPVAVPPEPERAPFPTHPAIPCTSCTHPQAAAALREVFNVYLAACRGEPHQTGSTLPHACCQRQLRCVDVRALVG